MISRGTPGAWLFGFALAFVGAGLVGDGQTSNQSGVTEPLILDIAGDGVSTVGPSEGVVFALNGPGQLVSTAWTHRDSDDAFLALEADHNGQITHGLELIGGASPGPNGFSTLAYYDGVTNLDRPEEGRVTGDGRLNQRDAVFDRLILWSDRNHNGVSEEEELASPGYRGVVEILLGYELVNRPLQDGSVVTLQGNALVKTPSGVPIYRKISAVRFSRKP